MDIISLAMAAKGGGGGSSETFIGNVSETTEHLPSARPDGSALQSGDYIKVDSRATLPLLLMVFNSLLLKIKAFLLVVLGF